MFVKFFRHATSTKNKSFSNLIPKFQHLYEQQNYFEIETEISKTFKKPQKKKIFTQQEEENVEEIMNNLLTIEKEKKHEFKTFPIYKIFWKLSEQQLSNGNIEVALNYLNKSIENCKETKRYPHLNITKASIIIHQNKIEEAQKLLLDAISLIRNQKIDENEIYLAKAYQQLGNIFEKIE